MQAVLTADIVNSTLLTDEHFIALVNEIKSVYKGELIEFYRGDSFQVLIQDAEYALIEAIKSRLLAKSFEDYQTLDIRISISIGNVESKVPALSSNMDKIFVNSGRLFDNFTNSNRKLLMSCGDEEKDFTFEIIAEYLDSLLEAMTSKQALVIYHMLSGTQQKDIAGKLQLSGATISKHVKTAHFDELQRLLEKYKIFVKKIAYGK